MPDEDLLQVVGIYKHYGYYGIDYGRNLLPYINIMELWRFRGYSLFLRDEKKSIILYIKYIYR